jgi:hypothetical protein
VLLLLLRRRRLRLRLRLRLHCCAAAAAKAAGLLVGRWRGVASRGGAATGQLLLLLSRGRGPALATHGGGARPRARDCSQRGAARAS